MVTEDNTLKFGAKRKNDGIHYEGKVYSEKEWQGLLDSADEVGMLLELCDKGSVYNPETKSWKPSEKLIQMGDIYERK